MSYIYNDEDNAPMNDHNIDGIRYLHMAADKNCHQCCRHSQECWQVYQCKGSNRGDFPDECFYYHRLDDLEMEVRDMPFYDPDDIPEEAKEDDDQI